MPPWFKLYAADFLLDPDVARIPPEAQALLLRMWCVCHREGSCPSDPETLAIRTVTRLQHVLQCRRYCEPFFELRDGRLFSRRMEAEKRRSEQAKDNASQRYKHKASVVGSAVTSGSGKANGNAIRTAQSQSQSQGQDQRHNTSHALTCERQKEPDPIVRRIYELYPRKVARAAAHQAIERALVRVEKEKCCSRGDAGDFIYAAVAKFRESPAGKKGGHTPHCATWMNQDKFFDDPQEWWKVNTNGNCDGPN